MALNRSIVTRGFGVASGGGGSPPTLPTIVVVNNDDGTATVTVDDSEAGATNTVRVIKVDTQWTWNEWVDTGESRTGDGDVDVPLSSGVYWFQVTSVGAGSETSSIPVMQWVSSGADPVLMQVLDAVVARIRTLLLADITSDKVQDFTAIDVKNLGELRENTILVVPLDQEGLDPGGPTNADFIEYPILVAACAPANRAHTDRTLRNKWFLWRERIRQSLITDKLTISTGTIVQTKYTPMTPYDRSWWERGGFVSPLVFRFVSKEPRP